MMEAGYSLMQMAKTSARLALLAEAGLPYISLLTDPTTGGVTASFAMLGDFNIAEHGKDLPKGFQSAEFVLEHGFLDFIVDRRELKQRLADVFGMLLHQEQALKPVVVPGGVRQAVAGGVGPA